MEPDPNFVDPILAKLPDDNYDSGGDGDCVATPDSEIFGPFPLTVSESTEFSGDNLGPSCADSAQDSNDYIFRFVATANATYRFEIFSAGFDPLLFILAESDCGTTELACSGDPNPPTNSLNPLIEIDFVVGQAVWITIDGYDAAGNFSLEISVV